MSKRLFGTIDNTKANYDYFKDSYIMRKEDLTRFFAEQTNNDFLEWFDDAFSDSPQVWKQLVSKSIFNQLHSIGSYKIAYRLEKLGFLPLEVKNEVTENIKEVARRTFDVTFLEDSNMQKFIGEEIVYELLEYYESEGIGLAEEEIDSFFDNIDLNEYLIEDIHSQFDLWCSSVELLKDKLSEADLLTCDLDFEFEKLVSRVEQRKDQIIEDHEIESEEDDSLHKELIEEFFGKAFRITQKNDLIKLVKDWIDKMVTNLNYNHEDAIIYIGGTLNSEGIQEFEVIRNLQDALHQYIENDTYSKPDSTF